MTPSNETYARLSVLAQSEALHNWRSVRSIALAWVSALPLKGREHHWQAQGIAFSVGRIDKTALEETRVEAWDSIDGRECDQDDPEVNRVRAVLCVLYPDVEMQDAQMFLETLFAFYTGGHGDATLALHLLNERV